MPNLATIGAPLLSDALKKKPVLKSITATAKPVAVSGISKGVPALISSGTKSTTATPVSLAGSAPAPVAAPYIGVSSASSEPVITGGAAAGDTGLTAPDVSVGDSGAPQSFIEKNKKALIIAAAVLAAIIGIFLYRKFAK